MKSLLQLTLEVTKELGDMCSASTIRDCKTITDRFEHEGLSFLTISLPAFCKDFEKSLSVGRVDRNMYKAFAFHAGLPRFLGGFLDLVFDRVTGVLLDVPDPIAIRAVRQITLLHSKIRIQCTPSREKAALTGYILTESEVKVADSRRTDEQKERFRSYSNLLFRDVFLEIEKLIFSDYVTPKHGPGKTADRLSGNAKWDNRVWTERLEKVAPAGDYLLPGYHYHDDFGTITWLSPEQELPVKVTLVPKTPKAPRIIAIEPTHVQYMQQSLLRLFVEGIKRDRLLNSFIGFDDQVPNQDLARRGSIDGSLATLDLSEASDRVSVEHVRLLTNRHELLWEFIDATRSRKAQVPAHGEILLSKYASMGSATCFPIEAMVFMTVILSSIGRQLNRQLTRRDCVSLAGRVRVFGDDIIVPNEYALGVIDDLEEFGFRVNRNKSFWTGRFRESCGKEYYAGTDVSVRKNRRVHPTSRIDAQEVESLVALRNFLYEDGLWTTCAWLDNRIRKLIPFPIVEPTSVGIGRFSFLPYHTERVEADRCQRPLVKAAVLVAPAPESPVSGVGSLLKWFLKEGLDPFSVESYERQGRPEQFHLRSKWVQPF